MALPAIPDSPVARVLAPRPDASELLRASKERTHCKLSSICLQEQEQLPFFGARALKLKAVGLRSHGLPAR